MEWLNLYFRMSDKRKNIAAQKAEAQRRLFRPSKRVTDTADVTEFEKKRLSIERRKDELVSASTIIDLTPSIFYVNF